MKLLENKVVIITGAARGIGEGIALKLAEHGAHIAFTHAITIEIASQLAGKENVPLGLFDRYDLDHCNQAAA